MGGSVNFVRYNIPFCGPYMNQGALSDNCFVFLTHEEQTSLEKIRAHYQKSGVVGFSIEETLSLIDRSYEAMGKRFRNRLNRKTIEFGRYAGDLYGVFLLISDSLRCFYGSKFFSETPKQSAESHKQHQHQIQRAKKLSDNAFLDIKEVITGLLPTPCSQYDEETLENVLKQLLDMQQVIDLRIERLNFSKRFGTKAEQFVIGVCDSLVWNAGIKPTKPLTDSKQKTPILRFLEVFYPLEAIAILSKIYEQERHALIDQKIGATFIKPK